MTLAYTVKYLDGDGNEQSLPSAADWTNTDKHYQPHKTDVVRVWRPLGIFVCNITAAGTTDQIPCMPPIDVSRLSKHQLFVYCTSLPSSLSVSTYVRLGESLDANGDVNITPPAAFTDFAPVGEVGVSQNELYRSSPDYNLLQSGTPRYSVLLSQMAPSVRMSKWLQLTLRPGAQIAATPVKIYTSFTGWY